MVSFYLKCYTEIEKHKSFCASQKQELLIVLYDWVIVFLSVSHKAKLLMEELVMGRIRLY